MSADQLQVPWLISVDGSGHTQPRDNCWLPLSWLGSWALSPAHSSFLATLWPSLARTHLSLIVFLL